MDSSQFDRITRAFAQTRLSRRSALSGASLGLAGVVVGSTLTRAQGTPVAGDGMAVNDATLFVQTAGGGTFLPNTLASPEAEGHGTHLLTLASHPGQTIWFSDRPQRNFGHVETGGFLENLGFTPENPPNAALVVSTPAGEDDILVLELLNPTYDEAADLLIYEANILGEYAGESLAPVADRQEDDELATEFEHASLFIDDCPDATACACIGGQGPIPGGPVHMCWDGFISCIPCFEPLDAVLKRCADEYAHGSNQCLII